MHGCFVASIWCDLRLKKQTFIHHLHNNLLFFKDNLIQVTAKIACWPTKHRWLYHQNETNRFFA
ncbi:hypothetical protein FFE93_014995 [Yersinia sp. KBS0713]|uniref:Uncharacterized protein n=1 Tax=Yersinia bercovieri TaxID=634 RepID=A0A2G4U241_YERBE|nr:hypothetical protein CS533_10700 [Yersinia bercovieri]QDW34234.1 hypothetical protein FFE93_014995 [Yersinia sp. KBS0713]